MGMDITKHISDFDLGGAEGSAEVSCHLPEVKSEDGQASPYGGTGRASSKHPTQGEPALEQADGGFHPTAEPLQLLEPLFNLFPPSVCKTAYIQFFLVLGGGPVPHGIKIAPPNGRTEGHKREGYKARSRGSPDEG